MTDVQIAYEYFRRSSTIDSVAAEFDQAPASIVKSIMSFFKSRPESSYRVAIRRKLQIELTRLFIRSNSTLKDFTEKYGIGTQTFLRLIGEVIEDTTLVPSDALADKIYRKLIYNRNSLGNLTPPRNIRIIAEIYVSNPYCSHSSIAFSYGLSRCSIGALLNRGVDQGILSEELADKVQTKRCYKANSFIMAKFAKKD